MRPIEVTLTPQTDADGICQSQTPAAGGAQALSLNGALGTTLDYGHLIVFAFSSSEVGRTLTLVGTDWRGISISEDVAGAASAATSTGYFKSITSITIDANSAGAITVGVDGRSASAWYILDQYKSPFNVSIACVLSASATYTMQHTFDDLQTSSDLNTEVTAFNNDDTALVSATTNKNGNYAFPITASRIVINAYTSGTVKLHLIQAGGL